MATISGVRLSDLPVLSLGTTGTKFYAVAGSNNYQIPEKSLYDTLYYYHISGAFQLQSEDWRFVHTTGSEYITGTKRFANNINTDLISRYSNLGSIHVPLINLENGTLLPRITAGISLDWSGKVLSGVWNSQQLRMITPIISGTAPSSPTSAGVSGQIAISGQKLFVCTGTNQWGYLNISPW